MPSGLFFFATGNDLRKALSDIDRELPIEFIESDFYNSPDDIERFTVNTITDLGISKYGDHSHRPITVISAGEQINFHESNQKVGVRYSVYNGENPNSITMWPGGFHGTDYIIEGRVDTLHKTEVSQKLMKLFRKHFKKNFEKKAGYHYIGPEALTYAEKVRFITICIKSPPEYDLTIV